MNDGRVEAPKLIDPSAERKAKAEERIKRAIDKTCAIIDDRNIRNSAVVTPLFPVLLHYVLEHELAD